ncbi:conjugative relaxase-like TrwC/TraI family protein [Arthrobacter sp. GAS37]|uniref:MobF family relaxase n=1 Tax=Arthrobacter sp. GAS37 TaxID=3156261 RepID=UPI003836BA32
MMSLHKLSAGDGYTYYISETASADELRAKGRELGDYYTVTGNPPGVWMGGGIANLGVSGTVAESQMKALFGEGLHPNAEAMIAAGMDPRDTRLGRGFYQYDGSETAFSRKVRAGYSEFKRRYKTEPDVDQRRVIKGRIGAEMFTAEHGRRPADKEELGRFMTASEKPKQQAVTGYDVTFAPPKSVSLLWALGGDEARKKVEKAHTDAIEASIKHFEARGVFTRSGFNGVEQRNVTGGLVITRFRHIDSRNGDPHLHDHGVIANRVLSEDGKTWLTLDGAQLYKLNVEISEFYNAAVTQNTANELDLATVQRDTGGNRAVTEIAGFDEAILTHASSRGTGIRKRTRALVKEFKDTHGYAPNPKQRIKLAQQANLDTRPAKEAARSAEAAVTAWSKEYKDAGFATGKKLMTRLKRAAKEIRATNPAPTGLDVPELAASVLDTVSTARAVWGEHHIHAEATRELNAAYNGSPVPEGAALAVTDYALNAGSIALNTTARNHQVDELYRADGASIYTKANTALYTSQAVLAAEDALLTAAQQDVIPAVTHDVFDLAVTGRSLTGRRELNELQLRYAREFACSSKLVTVGIGPAGAGKTTAMSLAAAAVNLAGGRVIGLAPSAVAADVLGKDLRDGRKPAEGLIEAETLAKFLHAHSTGKPGALAVEPGDVIIVDEAGMASTRDLAAVVAIAEGYGAVVRLSGDHYQLSAVGAGGALRLIAHYVGAVELEEVVRFRTVDADGNTVVHEAEAVASLILRDPETVRGAAAFDWYRQNGRITAGGTERMVNNAYAAWQQSVDEGKTALMMAADNATVRELNARAQAYRVATGVIKGARSAPLADDAQAHVGDTVLTRDINRKLRMNKGKDFIKNGDTCTVLKVHTDGALTVRDETHNGTVTLPAGYVKASVQLGYAATFNRAQGATVDKAFAIIREGVTRAQAYVAATRGRFLNQIFASVDTGVENDIVQNTQALDELLESIGNSVDRNLSGHELIDAAHTETHSVARLRAEYINTDTLAQQARVKLLLRATLGDAEAGKFIDGEAFGALSHRIREAETAGLDGAGIIATAYHQRGFEDAKTASAVLEWRIKGLTERSLELLDTAGDRPLGNLTDAQLAQLKTIALARHAKAGKHLADGVTLRSADGTAVPVRYPAGVQPWNKRTFGHLNDETLDARITKAENDSLYFIPSKDGKKARANTWLHKELTAEKTLRASLAAPVFASETAERGVLSVWTGTEEQAADFVERTDERGVQDTPGGIARRAKLIADGKDPVNETFPTPPLAPAEALTTQEKTPADKKAGKPEPKPRMAKDATAGSRNRLKQAGTILERITTEERLRTILPDPAALAEAAAIKAALEKAVPEWIAPTHALAYGLATGTIAETWTAELLTARDTIAAELGWAGAILAHEQPAWTTALGPVPSDPARRVEWENTAAQIAVFRETYNVPANDTAPVPAVYLETKPGEPQTGDLLKTAVTRIHKYTAQTHKAPATAESLAAAAAQARAEQLATGRTDAQNLAAAYLRQRAARVQLSPRQQQTLDAHNRADRIAGITPPPAEYLTGNSLPGNPADPRTPGTGPDGGEPSPALVPAQGGLAETLEATITEPAPAHPAQVHPVEVDYSLAAVPAGTMDHPTGMAATADLPVTPEPAPEPVLSRAEKAAARAVEFAQRLQDHADRAAAAAQARARAHELRDTTHTPAPETTDPAATDLPTPETIPATGPVHQVEEPTTPEYAPTAGQDTVSEQPAAPSPAVPEPSPVTAPDQAAEETVSELLPDQFPEQHVESAEQPVPEQDGQLHAEPLETVQQGEEETARWQQDALDRQVAVQAAALERQAAEHAKQAEKDRQAAQERARQTELRQLFPEVAKQPREVQDRALERFHAEKERQAEQRVQDVRTGIREALQRAGHQPGQETPAPQNPDAREASVVSDVQHAAETIRDVVDTAKSAASEPDTGGHAQEEFLQAQQVRHSPETVPETPEEYIPAAKEPGKTLAQRLAEIRAAQDKRARTTAPETGGAQEAADAAERLRRTLDELNQQQEQEQEAPAPQQQGPEPDAPGIRGPRL